MNSYKVEAVIIKRRDWKETDKMLTLFTKSLGKISVLAKGVRKITSKRAPSLELFNRTELVLHDAKFLDIVTETSLLNSYTGIKLDLHRIANAYQACELVDILTVEGQEHNGIFDLLCSYLDQINNQHSTALEQFKRQLLMTLGFLSEHDTISGEIDSFIESIAERKLLTARIYE